MGLRKDMATFNIYTKLDAGEPLPDNTGIPIEGFCIHNGLFKEVVEVPKTELGNAEKTVTNVQFRKNHGIDVEDVIGRVTFSKRGFDAVAQKDGVYYKAFIDQDETKIAGKVAKGLVNDVSIGFDFYPECSECGEDFRSCPHWFDEAHIIARNVEVYELSLVTRGADADATANIQKFMAQFDYKQDEKFKTTQNNAKEFEEKMNLIKGGKFMAEEDKKAVDLGDVVEKLTASQKEALQAQQLADEKEKEAKDLAAKLKAAEEEKARLEKENKTLTSDKDKLEKDYKDTTSKLTNKELSDKKTEVEKLVNNEIERKLTKESDKDTRIEELMGVDEVGLNVARDLVEKFELPKKQQGTPRIPSTEGFEKFLDQNGELKLDDPKVQQAYVQDIFRYDRVFKGTPEQAIPGQSYMGFYSHLEDKKVKLTR